jgi:hypothetical protein
MSKTPFEEDMGNMVHESDAPESKKSLAMNYVRATGRLANGSRNSIEAVSDAIVAQTPILLEIYLQTFPTLPEAAAMIAAHHESCATLHAEKHAAILEQIAHRHADDEVPAGAINWPRLAFAAISKATWPGAVVTIAAMFRSEIQQILSTF